MIDYDTWIGELYDYSFNSTVMFCGYEFDPSTNTFTAYYKDDFTRWGDLIDYTYDVGTLNPYIEACDYGTDLVSEVNAAEWLVQQW